MANATDPYEIAALKKKKSAYVDLMAAGAGTPWEDRGKTGAVAAFFRTCWMSIRHPGQLLSVIRRPETSGDTYPFVVGCGLMFGIAWCYHAIFFDLRAPKIELSAGFYVGWLLRLLAAPAAAVLVVKLGSALLYKLVSAEDMKNKAPPVLLFNVMAYCMGPSLLALVPFVGMAVAGVWIVGLWMYASATRLCVKTRAAVICCIIVALPIGGILAGVWLVINTLGAALKGQ